MDKPDMNAIAEKMVSAVRSFVARAEVSLVKRLDEFDIRLKSLPVPTNGKDGEHGEKGEQGQPGRNAFDVAVSVGFEGTVHDWLKSLDGKPGDPGASVTLEQVLPELRSELQKAVADLPVPKDGKDGESVTAEDFRTLFEAESTKALLDFERRAQDVLQKVIAQIPPAPKGEPGKDGESVYPDTVALMVRDEVQKAISALPPAKDGERGRDAVEITVLPGIDESRSYSAGTYARYNGGEIRAERRTDPVKSGDLAVAGWTVVRDGISAVVVTQGDDPRVIEVASMLTSGTKTVSDFAVPMLIDRGVWRAGQTYEKGDTVSSDGSTWIAQKDTESKPGTDGSWRLSVKRGRDGKDGQKGEKGEAGRDGKLLR